MVTARKRTILSPVIPRATKAKAEVAPAAPYKPRPGRAYRCRPTAENPFGGFDPAEYSDDLFDLEIIQSDWAAQGIESILEAAVLAGFGPIAREPLTVADLAREGLSRGIEFTAQGKPTLWAISAEGQRRIYESMGL